MLFVIMVSPFGAPLLTAPTLPIMRFFGSIDPERQRERERERESQIVIGQLNSISV